MQAAASKSNLAQEAKKSAGSSAISGKTTHKAKKKIAKKSDNSSGTSNDAKARSLAKPISSEAQPKKDSSWGPFWTWFAFDSLFNLAIVAFV